jgi:hypothetical protein
MYFDDHSRSLFYCFHLIRRYKSALFRATNDYLPMNNASQLRISESLGISAKLHVSHSPGADRRDVFAYG